MASGWRQNLADVITAIRGTLADAALAGSMSAADFLKLAGLPSSAVPTTRSVGTTAPLTGGGDLSADRTLAISAASGAAAGSMAAADFTKVAQVRPGASWDIATVTRTFLYDPVNGSDSNPGFSDGAGPYNPATLAKQTLAGIQSVLPVNFAGRKFRLIMAAGTYADGLDKLFNGATGIPSGSLVRGTATNATANATAFADDTADRIYQGWTTATGMNAPGYHPTGAPTTTVVQCLTLAGGAPGFGAEPALPLGARIRFDAATTTVALRNICRMVSAVSGTDTVTCDSALPAVPVAGDTFYIEIGGLALPTSTLSVVGTGVQSAFALCGITCAGTFGLANGDYLLCGVKANVISCNGFTSITEGTAYTDLSGSVTIGGAVRAETTATYQRGALFQSSAHVTGTGTTAISAIQQTAVVFGAFITGSSISLGESGAQLGISGGRVIGSAGLAGYISSGRVGISGVSITGMGAKPAIRLQQGNFNVAFLTSTVTGSTGNTDVGLDASNARGSLISMTSQPTVTGTAGDVRVAGGKIITWAQAFAGFVDQAGNRFVGAPNVGKYPIGRFSGSMPIAGAAGFVYASDIGATVETNAVPIRRPTSGRLATVVRLSAPAGTPAGVSLTATLYQNGVATALTCTIAAASPAGTKAVGTGVILFVDGDDYDLRIDTGAATVATLQFTASVEGP